MPVDLVWGNDPGVNQVQRRKVIFQALLRADLNPMEPDLLSIRLAGRKSSAMRIQSEPGGF
jgi:hypothetical protein